ncbi:putative deoxyribodipyrimidine photo-lyase [Helianthus anomalus]
MRKCCIKTLKDFARTRLMIYADDRNIPTKYNATSRLSPYLHFGQISAQRCALEARKFRKDYQQVRTLWSDNFCYYEPHYDSFLGACDWGRATLMDHVFDKRERIYTGAEPY